MWKIVEQIKFVDDRLFGGTVLFSLNNLAVDAVCSLLVHEHLMRSYSLDYWT